MDPLSFDQPALSEHRLRRRKDHLMDEIARQEHPRRQPARRISAIVSIAAAAVLVTGGAALASHVLGGPSIWRQDDGSVAIDGSALRPAYQGRYLTADELADLQAQGLATISANNRELACQGITLYFDTDAQWQAYLDDFEARDTGDAATPAAGSDPCEPYADSPRYVTGS